MTILQPEEEQKLNGVFELSDLRTERRLCHEDLLGRTGKVQCLSGCLDVSEETECKGI